MVSVLLNDILTKVIDTLHWIISEKVWTVSDDICPAQ